MEPAAAQFDRLLASARAVVACEPAPMRAELSEHEIEMVADYHYASQLREDEDVRRNTLNSDALYSEVARDLRGRGVQVKTPFEGCSRPRYGLSPREFNKVGEALGVSLEALQAAYARGDVSWVEDELDELFAVFRFRLAPQSEAYRHLGMAVLARTIEATEGALRRHRGQPVATPKLIEPHGGTAAVEGSTLSAALEGWRRATAPRQGTSAEFGNAVKLFVELHGDMPVPHITKRHIRLYREALQRIPLRRVGKLRGASLPALVEWKNNHPDAPTISNGTANKLLGGVGAIVGWAGSNGYVSDDAAWANPFAKMKLEEEQPDREPWEIEELRLLFASPVYAQGHRPKGGAGEAAYWLPLLGLFTGGRRGELAALTPSDIRTDHATGIAYIVITEDPELEAKVKTARSRRVVPLHPELLRFGFVEVVRSRAADSPDALLFPLVKKGPKGGYGEAWSKWFGHYIRGIGVRNTNRVFHSFRHNFKDALRQGAIGDEISDALTGHSGGGVGRTYGAKDMLARFGAKRLYEAVASVRYPGLELSRLIATREAVSPE